jgi:hypothetical protein
MHFVFRNAHLSLLYQFSPLKLDTYHKKNEKIIIISKILGQVMNALGARCSRFKHLHEKGVPEISVSQVCLAWGAYFENTPLLRHYPTQKH